MKEIGDIITRFKKSLYSLKNNSILKNIIILLSGTILVQVLNFLSYPIISRLYSPEAFGTFATFTAIFSILEPVSCLRLELAVIMPKSENIAFKVLIAAILSSLIYSFIICLLLLISGERLVTTFNLQNLKAYIPFISLSLFGAGIFKALMAWNIRKKTFKNIVRSQIQQILYKNITQITLGFAKIGAVGLIIGFFVSQITGLWVLVKTSLSFFLQRKRFLSQRRLLIILGKYKKFPSLSAPSALLNALGLYLPTPLLSHLYGPETAGLFAFSVLVVATPFRILGQSISQVYISEGAELYRNSNPNIILVFNKLANRLLIMGILPMLFFFLFGEMIFSIIFGAKWAKSGEMTKYLIFAYYTQFISTSVSQILNIIGKQKVLLAWDILRLVIILVSFLVIQYLKVDRINAVVILSFGMCVSYLLLGFICRRYIMTIKFH